MQQSKQGVINTINSKKADRMPAAANNAEMFETDFIPSIGCNSNPSHFPIRCSELASRNSWTWRSYNSV